MEIFERKQTVKRSLIKTRTKAHKLFRNRWNFNKSFSKFIHQNLEKLSLNLLKFFTIFSFVKVTNT